MTDRQFAEYLAKKTLNELLDQLVQYGRMYESCKDDKDKDYKIGMIDYATGYVKAEIETRVCGLA